MIPMPFHLSNLEVSSVDLYGLKGFSPDLHEALINLGLRQDLRRVMDAEFITNMGVLCTSMSIMATLGKVDSDWRFSQFGILYLVDDRSMLEVTGMDESKTIFNHTEFSLVIAIMACRENMLGALMNGFKNPFRLSYFYQNMLIHCINQLIDGEHIDKKKVTKFLDIHNRKELLEHEPFFESYLSLNIAQV
jgi:hypothetical protein